jgi:hypothetical protein
MLLLVHSMFVLVSDCSGSQSKGECADEMECGPTNNKRTPETEFAWTHISETMPFHCSQQESITHFCQEVLPNSDKEWFASTCSELHELGMDRCKLKASWKASSTSPSSQKATTTEALMIDLQVPKALYRRPSFPIRLGDGSIIPIKSPSNAVDVCQNAFNVDKGDCRQLLSAADPMGTVRWGSIDIVARQYEDSPQAHFERKRGFEWQLAGLKHPLLSAHADYVFRKRLGFVDKATHWLWKLLVDAMPSGFQFLEIGVYKGSVPSLVKMLANMAQKKATVYGITPLGEPEPGSSNSSNSSDRSGDSSGGSESKHSGSKSQVHKSDRYFVQHSYDTTKEHFRQVSVWWSVMGRHASRAKLFSCAFGRVSQIYHTTLILVALNAVLLNNSILLAGCWLTSF